MLIKRLLIVLTLCSSLFILGCGNNTTTSTTVQELDYGDFDYISDFDEIFNRRQETYLVYIYSSYCSACASIKNDVLTFAATFEDYPIYFLNASPVASSDYISYYLDATGQEKVLTPTLIVVKNNNFDKNNVSRYLFVGSIKIKSALTDMQQGAYSYWD